MKRNYTSSLNWNDSKLIVAITTTITTTITFPLIMYKTQSLHIFILLRLIQTTYIIIVIFYTGRGEGEVWDAAWRATTGELKQPHTIHTSSWSLHLLSSWLLNSSSLPSFLPTSSRASPTPLPLPPPSQASTPHTNIPQCVLSPRLLIVHINHFKWAE